jgi:hypothetical protein
MAPPFRKRTGSSATPHGNAKRAAVSKRPAASKSTATYPTVTKQAASKFSGPKTPSKGSGIKSLSTLGFSSSKRPKYQVGTKILLDDTIYTSKVPDDVKGHLFVYEITDVSDDGKSVTVTYKNQVIRPYGDQFRVYEDSDSAQVRSYVFFVICRHMMFVHMRVPLTIAVFPQIDADTHRSCNRCA